MALKKELGGRRAERGSHLLDSLLTKKDKSVSFCHTSFTHPLSLHVEHVSVEKMFGVLYIACLCKLGPGQKERVWREDQLVHFVSLRSLRVGDRNAEDLQRNAFSQTQKGHPEICTFSLGQALCFLRPRLKAGRLCGVHTL